MMSWGIALLILAVAVVSALAVALLVVMHKRRRTPRLQFDLDTMPPIDQLLESLAGLTRGVMYGGNDAKIYQNGALFDAMLDDVADADATIHFETFVWSTGLLEQRWVDALIQQAQRGVEVRVLIDAIGGKKASRAELDRLRAAGASVLYYCPPSLGNWRRFNHRSHRKLLIVDGRVGYTFGHGIADQWLGDAEDADHWRDSGIRLTGPIVHGLQTVFAENWVEESRELLIGDDCFPELDDSGDLDAHVVSSASGDSLSTVSMTYTIAIAAARSEVLIQNPYFAPDRGLVDLLAQQVERGVRIQMMVPGKQTDSPFVRRAGCHLYDELLSAGVRIHEYQPTLCHQKIMIVDGLWSHVGSTNFDARSLELNEEISVGVIDEAIAAELIAAFEHDLTRSHELTLAGWRRRPRRQRPVEHIAYWLHEQL